ncbi:hypothetical protein [Litorilituus lipolyticus]|uniref:Hemerythrin-like domain-containing protein n=1 Tax=Litorilituus lipolyticus TaxID=2491017 RepID=A0A502KLM0_9GAMM|nr:hypothetical protein [Litorilituus lipolyticus]TPH12498.1 hypothetical protein EPA86_16230 [Litorilituus lipolyticus]
MKRDSLDSVIKSNDIDIIHLNDDHKDLFNYIARLNKIAKQPKDYDYAIIILERLISFFVEHVIKEELLLQKYLPAHVVKEHALLHQNELTQLDNSLHLLQTNLSSSNIHTVVAKLEREFTNHICRSDRKIMQDLIKSQKNMQHYH